MRYRNCEKVQFFGLATRGLGPFAGLCPLRPRSGHVLMAAHMLEVLVWALAYAIVDAAPAGADLVYFALVNYTTLGYGDVTPMARWRLLGPMAAMNGVLLFGWSTAVIFQVLRRTMLSVLRRRRLT